MTTSPTTAPFIPQKREGPYFRRLGGEALSKRPPLRVGAPSLEPPDDPRPLQRRVIRCLLNTSRRRSVAPSRYPQTTGHPKGRNVAVSVLFRIDQNGRIQVVDGGPAQGVVVDADG